MRNYFTIYLFKNQCRSCKIREPILIESIYPIQDIFYRNVSATAPRIEIKNAFKHIVNLLGNEQSCH